MGGGGDEWRKEVFPQLDIGFGLATVNFPDSHQHFSSIPAAPASSIHVNVPVSG